MIILKRFKEMGLSKNEAKSYMSLLEKNVLTVSEVSRIAGIPRANAYEALEKLMAKGMCISKPGATKKFSATDPLLIQEKLLAEVKGMMEIELERLSDKEKEIKEKHKFNVKNELEKLSKAGEVILEKSIDRKKNVINMVNELESKYKAAQKKNNPLDYIEIIKDHYQIHKKFLRLMEESKEEVLIFVKPPFTGPLEKMHVQLDQKSDMLKRQVRAKVIYELPTKEKGDSWLWEIIKRSVKAGEEARVIRELPTKMAVFDERIIILFLEDPISRKTSLTALIVEHRTMAKSLKILFEALWEQSEDYHILSVVSD